MKVTKSMENKLTTAQGKHWRDKKLSEMNSRDWRILREDFDIRIAGGRAVFTQKVVWQDSLVYVASTSGAVANLTVYSMGCGWNDPPYQERP